MTSDSSASINAMPITIRRANVSDLASVAELLVRNRLPADGVREAFDDFIVAERDRTIVGAIGLELFGDAALLRSAVVTEKIRGTGLGARLVESVIAHAHERMVRSVYLLTTTAENYFPRFGFARVTRADVPLAVRKSVEFSGACPESAVVMMRILEPTPRT